MFILDPFDSLFHFFVIPFINPHFRYYFIINFLYFPIIYPLLLLPIIILLLHLLQAQLLPLASHPSLSDLLWYLFGFMEFIPKLIHFNFVSELDQFQFIFQELFYFNYFIMNFHWPLTDFTRNHFNYRYLIN